MHFIKHFFIKGILLLLCVKVFAICNLNLNTNDIIFQADIHYLDPKLRTDPYIFAYIHGKAEKFVLDTGSNGHIMRKHFLANLNSKKEQFSATHSVGEGEVTQLFIADDEGRTSSQKMLLVKDFALAKEGISGLLSPQVLAGKFPFLIDFEQGCFTVGKHIDVASFKGYQVFHGQLKANPYQVMMVSLYLNDKEMTVDIDSGSKDTSLLSHLINDFPLDHQRLPKRSVDLLGVAGKSLSFRKVNFVLNDLTFNSFSVKSLDKSVDAGEFKTMGRVGMDVLKNFIIAADFSQNTFHLLRIPKKLASPYATP